MQRFMTSSVTELHSESRRHSRIICGVSHGVLVRAKDGSCGFFWVGTSRLAVLEADNWLDDDDIEYASAHEVAVDGTIGLATYLVSRTVTDTKKLETV